MNLWGFGPGSRLHEVPSDAAIAAARERVGYARIELDPATRRALQPGNVYVDLASVAKGFGTDQIARYLEREGVANYLVDISGELRAHGHRPDGSDWHVGIEKPGAAAGAASAENEIQRVIRLRDKSMATSGDYRRGAHTLDPRTGRPIAHGTVSVSVLHDSALRVDAWATALTVLHPEEAMALATREAIAARLLIVADGDTRERVTPALAAMLED